MRISKRCTTAMVLTMAAALAGCDVESRPATGMVADTDFDVPPAWTVKPIMGREFRPIMPATDALWSCPSSSNRAKAKECGVESVDWPLFRECALFHTGFRTPFDHISFTEDFWKVGNWHIEPAAPRLGKTGPVKFEELFRPAEWTSLKENVHPDAPVFVSLFMSRPGFLLNDRYDTDNEDFAAWAKLNPNFAGFDVMAESENDIGLYIKNFHKVTNAVVYARLARDFPCPETQRDWAKTVDRCWERERGLLFGDTRTWAMAAGCYTHLLMHAKNGATGLMYEGSASQPLAAWQVAGGFMRGATRQFGGLPFAWYAAHFYSGYTREGKGRWGQNKWCRYPWSQKVPKPDDRDAPYAGTSRSLMDRQFAYGYLIGASFAMPECAHALYYTQDKDGKYVPSGYAKDMNDLYEFSKRNLRGPSYSTTAILVPISERYGHSYRGWGVRNEAAHWFDDIFSQNAVFHTLVPMNDHEATLRKKGFQGCLFNSPYAEFWDVLTPDCGQSGADFLKALSAYKVAFLIGSYDPKEVDIASLNAYVRGGGTLVVPADAIEKGIVSEALAGLRLTGQVKKSGLFCRDEEGTRFALTEAYEWMEAQAKRARPLVSDDCGNIAVWANNVGAGRVVTVACWRMLPARYKGVRESFGDDLSPKAQQRYETEFYDPILTGERRFDIIEYLFRRVQDETLPVTITGDVHAGVQKTADGWNVWFMNHKGVVHFSNEPEEFDPDEAAHVKVGLKDLDVAEVRELRTGREIAFDDSFSLTVKPGRWILVHVKVR